MSRFGLLLLIISGLMANASDVFDHEIKGYPSNLRNCDSVANELAQKFLDAAKVEIYWAKGSKISETECNIKLSYIANERLNLPATVDRDSLSAVEWKGLYPTYADCEKSLEVEKTLFVQETGLSPWISYCGVQRSYTGKTSYYPVIEAVGKPIKQFFGSGSTVGGTPLIGWEQALKEIKQGAEARGIAVASVSGFSVGVAFEVRMRFYTKERNWLINEKFGKFTEPSACESQVDYIKSTFSKVQVPPIAALCAKDYEGFTLNIVNLTPDIIKSKPLWERVDPKTYTSLTDCLSQIGETEKVYTEKFNKKVMVGFCFNSSPDTFQVMLLEDSFRP